jgi:glycine cleavage system transcriptional repressor
MAKHALISVIGPDRQGLISDIAGRLFDLGLSLGDTTFAVLGELAEFTCLGEVPDEIGLAAIEQELAGLDGLADARITVTGFDLGPVHGESGHITHRIEMSGPDRPGVIARLSEVFGQFGANIVRMNSERVPGEQRDDYITRFAVWIPERRAAACLATLANTAGEMRMTFRYEEVDTDV